MTTTSYSKFKRTILRSENLIALHVNLVNKQGRPAADKTDILRAAVVFAIGSLDAYLSEVTSEVLVEYFRHGSQTNEQAKLLERLSKDIKHLPFEIAFVDDVDKRRELIRNRIASYFYQEVSNHGWKAIVNTFSHLGCESGQKQSTQQKIESGWNNLDCCDYLDSWTKFRHRVIHQGQADNATREDTKNLVSFIKEIVEAIDEIACFQLAKAKGVCSE